MNLQTVAQRHVPMDTTDLSSGAGSGSGSSSRVSPPILPPASTSPAISSTVSQIDQFQLKFPIGELQKINERLKKEIDGLNNELQLVMNEFKSFETKQKEINQKDKDLMSSFQKELDRINNELVPIQQKLQNLYQERLVDITKPMTSQQLENMLSIQSKHLALTNEKSSLENKIAEGKKALKIEVQDLQVSVEFLQSRNSLTLEKKNALVKNLKENEDAIKCLQNIKKVGETFQLHFPLPPTEQNQPTLLQQKPQVQQQPLLISLQQQTKPATPLTQQQLPISLEQVIQQQKMEKLNNTPPASLPASILLDKGTGIKEAEKQSAPKPSNGSSSAASISASSAPAGSTSSTSSLASKKPNEKSHDKKQRKLETAIRGIQSSINQNKAELEGYETENKEFLRQLEEFTAKLKLIQEAPSLLNKLISLKKDNYTPKDVEFLSIIETEKGKVANDYFHSTKAGVKITVALLSSDLTELRNLNTNFISSKLSLEMNLKSQKQKIDTSNSKNLKFENSLRDAKEKLKKYLESEKDNETDSSADSSSESPSKVSTISSRPSTAATQSTAGGSTLKAVASAKAKAAASSAATPLGVKAVPKSKTHQSSSAGAGSGSGATAEKTSPSSSSKKRKPESQDVVDSSTLNGAQMNGHIHKKPMLVKPGTNIP
ncbi:MAG: hypothetical protein H0W88_01680 [Parachlamydiaceae bacterium]|nr:hypothetical protein [Parachlamydiaceae bacterium]